MTWAVAVATQVSDAGERRRWATQVSDDDVGGDEGGRPRRPSKQRGRTGDARRRRAAKDR